MKTLSKIIIILAVFVMLSSLMVTVVNASGTTGGALSFDRLSDEEGFQPRADFSEGERPERGEDGDGGWIFGVIKNVGVIAVITTVIVWPKSIRKAKRKAAGVQVSGVS